MNHSAYYLPGEVVASKGRGTNRKPISQQARNKMEFLIDEACKLYGITRERFVSKRRCREEADARKVFCYVAFATLGNEIYKMDLADAINKDHTSVITAIKKAEWLLETDEEFAHKLYSLRRKTFSNG